MVYESTFNNTFGSDVVQMFAVRSSSCLLNHQRQQTPSNKNVPISWLVDESMKKIVRCKVSIAFYGYDVVSRAVLRIYSLYGTRMHNDKKKYY